jgi:hypothetical protein
MAVTRRSISNAGSATCNKPSGAVTNVDWLVAFASRFNSTTPPALPAGWTNLANGAHSAFTASFRAAYRLADASTSYTFTNAQEIHMLCYHGAGVLTSNPFGATAGTRATLNTGGSSATITANGITTEADNALLLAWLTHGANNPTSNNGMTLIGGNGSGDVLADNSIWDATQVVAGASGNKAWGVSPNSPFSALLLHINAASIAQPRFHAQIIG